MRTSTASASTLARTARRGTFAPIYLSRQHLALPANITEKIEEHAYQIAENVLQGTTWMRKPRCCAYPACPVRTRTRSTVQSAKIAGEVNSKTSPERRCAENARKDFIRAIVLRRCVFRACRAKCSICRVNTHARIVKTVDFKRAWHRLRVKDPTRSKSRSMG